MHLYRGIVLANDCIAEVYYHIKIQCAGLAKEVKEGQIIYIRCNNLADPLLRRPFSIYRFDETEGIVEFVYIVKGKGTEIVKKLRPGDAIDLLGPGGRCYELAAGVKAICIIGRGVGIASVVSIAEKARKLGIHVTAILSGRTETAVISRDFLSEIGCDVASVNDQENTSSPEHVTQLLEAAINRYGIGQIFTCGSNRIGRLVRDVSRKYNIPAYVSLEERMACGIGICYGCVCETKNGYKTVCKDGPVFAIEEVVL